MVEDVKGHHELAAAWLFAGLVAGVVIVVGAEHVAKLMAHGVGVNAGVVGSGAGAFIEEIHGSPEIRIANRGFDADLSLIDS